MSIQDVSAERLAKLCHQYRETLAQDSNFNCDSGPSWDQTPQQERKLMVAATHLALLELATSEQEQQRQYFAKPGEADWGC